MTNQLAKQTGTLKSLIQGPDFKAELAKSLPRHLSPDRFARIAITALSRTPKLAECTQISLFKCLLDLSSAGLEPDNRRAYLIPYGKECTLIISYMGLIELIRRSGDVDSIRAETVCEKDEFSWENGIITHNVNWRAPRGKIQAVYAEAHMKSGEIQSATMTLEEVNGIRDRSKASKSGPWVTDYSEMAKKTAIRRLSKLLPLSSEISDTINRVDQPLEDNMKRATPADESFFDQQFGGSSEEPEEREEKEAIQAISEERLQFILDRLKDEGKTEAWFCKLAGTNNKKVAELSMVESSEALTAWEGGAE